MVRYIPGIKRYALNSVYADGPRHQHINENIHSFHHALAMITPHCIHRFLLDEYIIESNNHIYVKALMSGEGKGVKNGT